MNDAGRLLVHGGTAGFALHGGQWTLRPGRYKAVVWLDPGPVAPAGTGTIEVCADHANTLVARQGFDAGTISAVAPFIDIAFTLGRTLQGVEIRLFGEAGFTATIASVELMRSDGAARRDRPLHILYMSTHVVLEYDELRMLTDSGHRVFSFEGGAYHVPDSTNAFRPSPPQLFQPDDFQRYMRIGLCPAFIAGFDAVIVMAQPRRVPAILAMAGDVPVIYRGIGQVAVGAEDMLIPHAGRLHVVRYSEREVGLPGLVETDDVIRFGKYAGDYDPDWVGDGPMLAIMNGFAGRSDDSAPNLAQFRAITEGFACALYGNGNEGLAEARGVLPWVDLPGTMKHASLFLHASVAGPSYTLSVIEALAAGVPVVAPTAAFVVANVSAHQRWYGRVEAARYEVPALLQHDDRMLFSSVAEAREKIAWLLRNTAYCRMVSRRQRDTFATLFAAERVRAQWDAVLRKVTDRLP